MAEKRDSVGVTDLLNNVFLIHFVCKFFLCAKSHSAAAKPRVKEGKNCQCEKVHQKSGPKENWKGWWFEVVFGSRLHWLWALLPTLGPCSDSCHDNWCWRVGEKSKRGGPPPPLSSPPPHQGHRRPRAQRKSLSRYETESRVQTNFWI